MCANHVLRSNIETGRGSSYFGYPWMRGLVLEHNFWKLEGGVKLIAPKIDFYFFARASYFWRAPNFWDKLRSLWKLLYLTDFAYCSLFALKTHWLKWGLPPLSYCCRHFFPGTFVKLFIPLDAIYLKNKNLLVFVLVLKTDQFKVSAK